MVPSARAISSSYTFGLACRSRPGTENTTGTQGARILAILIASGRNMKQYSRWSGPCAQHELGSGYKLNRVVDGTIGIFD